MAGYTKEFLVGAYMSRFIECTAIDIEALDRLETQASNFYDEVGKDKFRVYATLDAEAIRTYKNQLETA